MDYIKKADRNQLSFLPECIDDYIDENNPVRLIDAFVDGLEMGALGFRKSHPNETGRPAYDPRDLLKLYIYGYILSLRLHSLPSLVMTGIYEVSSPARILTSLGTRTSFPSFS